MQEWLDDHDILMYLTHNEGKSVVAERFTITMKGKISNKVTANDSVSYLGYFNQSVDEYSNACHSIDKKCIHVDYSVVTEEIVRITKYKNILSKGCTENCSKEVLVIDSVLKTNPWAYKIKDLNGGKTIEAFMKVNR